MSINNPTPKEVHNASTKMLKQEHVLWGDRFTNIQSVLIPWFNDKIKKEYIMNNNLNNYLNIERIYFLDDTNDINIIKFKNPPNLSIKNIIYSEIGTLLHNFIKRTNVEKNLKEYMRIIERDNEIQF